MNGRGKSTDRWMLTIIHQKAAKSKGVLGKGVGIDKRKAMG
jgi:hypothetical protein